MPLILKFEFADGSTEEQKIPAEIWRLNQDKVSKVFVFEKELQRIELDPYLETADTDRSNNYFPPKQEIGRFELFRQKLMEQRYNRENPMQRENRAKEKTNGTN